MADIKSVCSRKYKAVHSSGQRKPSEILWVVMHSEEATTAESAAKWFTNPDSQGSAHLCLDDTICYRTLNNTDVPWAAPGANQKGFHIEQAGFARWNSIAWLRHRKTLQRAAYKTALHCQLFGIPVTFVTAAGLKRNTPGITTHAECTKAFGGSHTDPGVFWPRRTFMRYVRQYYIELTT